MKEKHFYFYKNWFFFPLCIEWSECPEYIKETHRLTIHFLWWHWKWTFTKEG